MRTWPALAATLASLGSALPLHAQTLVGTWQITIDGRKQVAKFAKGPDGRLHGEYFNVGEDPVNGNPLTVSVKGRRVHFAFEEQDLSFNGELSADGTTLTGRAARGSLSFPPTTYRRATAKTAWVIDPSPHKTLFVTVEKGVKLEVLDWGGNGPPLVFLAGAGNTAHVFDDFAPKFTGKHHVYGITRRGFGLSGRPAPTQDNYDSDRLGDDVLAVIGALKLNLPVIAGHSLAGEELSSIGTRHPEKVSGLIYLDAGYEYAFYIPGSDNIEVDTSTMRRDLQRLLWATPAEQKALIQEMQATLPPLQKELQRVQEEAERAPDRPSARRMLQQQIEEALFTSMRKYAGVKTPSLAIFASPHACSANCDSPEVKSSEAATAAQADAFEAGTPHARVLRIPGANHYVFRSNEAQVAQEMDAFIDGLH